MLKRLHIKNFTVFKDADFQFGPGLNVIVGTNGMGKSHVLKLGYIAARVTAKILGADYLAPVPENWSRYLADLLNDVFQPEELGELVRWNKKKTTASVAVEFKGESREKLAFTFSSLPKKADLFDKSLVEVSAYPRHAELSRAIFIPPKEVLTLAWLRSIFEKRTLPIDDTYPALLELLNEIPLRTPDPETELPLRLLEGILGGQIEVKGDRYYLVSKQRRLEMNLVAEGVRKFAMLARLLRNGVLVPDNPLFWDEPEANLNPALLKKLAAVLADLARENFQVVLATHSLYLLKELHILAQEEAMPLRYFSLSSEQPGGPTVVKPASSLPLLPNIAALEAEMEQADEFLNALNRDDASV